MRLHQIGDLALKGLAHGAWKVAAVVNRRMAEGRFQPKWAPAPLLKSREKSRPPLGTPRTTDSLCPQCVFETREKVLAGDLTTQQLIALNPGPCIHSATSGACRRLPGYRASCAPRFMCKPHGDRRGSSAAWSASSRAATSGW
jgi:hypothetical protein